MQCPDGLPVHSVPETIGLQNHWTCQRRPIGVLVGLRSDSVRCIWAVGYC